MWAERVVQSDEQPIEVNGEPVLTFYDESNTDDEVHSVISTRGNETSNQQKNFELFDPDATKCPPLLASQCCEESNINSQAHILDMIEKLHVSFEDLKRKFVAVERRSERVLDEDVVSIKTELAFLTKRFDRVYGKKI